MSDIRLQSLYRRLTAPRAEVGAIEADAIVEALQRHGHPDEEGTVLDRIAGSAAEADVLRVALALTPDAQALSQEVAALRSASRQSRAPARRWLAVAASVGAVAVLFAMLRVGPHPMQAPVPAASPPSDDIFSVSFESPAGERVEMETDTPIFRADFDS